MRTYEHAGNKVCCYRFQPEVGEGAVSQESLLERLAKKSIVGNGFSKDPPTFKLEI